MGPRNSEMLNRVSSLFKKKILFIYLIYLFLAGWVFVAAGFL